MLKVQETTKWDDSFVPNHIYYLDDSKTRMLGYINVLNNQEIWFEGGRGFSSRNRTFKVLQRLKDRVASKTKSWEVDGSKGNKYTVQFDGTEWSCSCPAFAYKAGPCKHIKMFQK